VKPIDRLEARLARMEQAIFRIEGRLAATLPHLATESELACRSGCVLSAIAVIQAVRPARRCARPDFLQSGVNSELYESHAGSRSSSVTAALAVNQFKARIIRRQ
jgi:hypothetical protein